MIGTVVTRVHRDEMVALRQGPDPLNRRVGCHPGGEKAVSVAPELELDAVALGVEGSSSVEAHSCRRCHASARDLQLCHWYLVVELDVEGP